MYNKETKNAFIASENFSDELKAQICAAFEWCEEAENLFEKDVSEFNTSEFEILLNHDAAIRYTLTLRYKNLIRKYVQWRIDNKSSENVELLDHIANVNIEANNVESYTVGSPAEAMEWIKSVTPRFEAGYFNDCRVRIILIAAYTGITVSEILKAKRSDIDFEKKIWYNNGEELIIWDEFIPHLKEYLKRKDFYVNSKHGEYTLRVNWNNDLVLPERIMNDKIVSNKINQVATLFVILRQTYFEENFSDFPYSVRDFALSGKFYRKYKGVGTIPAYQNVEYRRWEKVYH